MKVKKKITVVVCTYNRGDILGGCIESLLKQTLDKSKFDILIVDNNSSDNTREIIQEYANQKDNLKYVFEKEQGLSNARNRGAVLATTEYVAYIDDDAIAFENWLEEAVETIKDKDPMIFGGPIFPFYLTEKPEWFKDEYEIRIHQEKTGWMKKDRYISGSNYFIKKEILKEVGWFSTDKGMNGDSLAYGEENEVVRKVNGLGENCVYYNTNMKVRHLVPKFKMSLQYFIFRNYKAGKTIGEICNNEFRFDEQMRMLQMLDSLITDFETALNGKFDKDRFPEPMNYLVERVIPRLYQIGKYNQYFLQNSGKDIYGYLEYSVRNKKDFKIKKLIRILGKIVKMYIKFVLRKIRKYTELLSNKFRT